MPITNPLPIISPVVQEVKPVVKPEVKPYVAQTPLAPPQNGLKVGGHGNLKYAKPGGNPAVPASSDYTSGRMVNSVPQTQLPHPPQDSYLSNAIR
jgi:hypothetical protein